MLDNLADEIIKYQKGSLGLVGRVEGLPQEGWILLDYGDLIVHLFSPVRRDYYRLEELWGQGKVLLHLH